MTELNFTDMGAYNIVRFIGEPEDVLQMFTPENPGETYGRLEDVETAITFINEGLGVDEFNNVGHEHGVSYDEVADQMLRGYLLEKIRFQILKEDWEPMFNPLPSPDSLNHFVEPDVSVTSPHDNKLYISVDMRLSPNGDGCDDEPYSFIIIDQRHTPNLDYNWSVNAFGVDSTGEELEPMLSEWFDEVTKDVNSSFEKELGEKLNTAITQAEQLMQIE